MDKLQQIIDRVNQEIQQLRSQANRNLDYAQGAADALKRVVDEWNVDISNTEAPPSQAETTEDGTDTH